MCLLSYSFSLHTYMHAQPLPILFHPMDYSPPASSVHGISQAGILEWVAISFSSDIFLEAILGLIPQGHIDLDLLVPRVCMWVHGKSLQLCLFATPWTVARQAPLSVSYLIS